MKVLSFIFLFTSIGFSSFLPKSFRLDFQQEYKGIISNKIKSYPGTLFYEFPGKVRAEIKGKQTVQYIANKKKAWFISEGLEGKKDVKVLDLGKDKKNFMLAELFDVLKHGMITNPNYSVIKDGKVFKLIFSSKVQSLVGFESADVSLNLVKNPSLRDIQSMTLKSKKRKNVSR